MGSWISEWKLGVHVVSTVMGVSTREGTKEGARPSLRGEEIGEDQEGFMEEASSFVQTCEPIPGIPVASVPAKSRKHPAY